MFSISGDQRGSCSFWQIRGRVTGHTSTSSEPESWAWTKAPALAARGTVKGHAESAQWEEEQVTKAWDGGGEKIVYPPPKNGKQEYGSSKFRRMEQQMLLYGRLKLYPLKTTDPRLGDYEATGFRSREVPVSW